jgi:hypothetical protein
MTATHNPQAAADQARTNYRDVTAQLGLLGLDTLPFRRACAPLPKRV